MHDIVLEIRAVSLPKFLVCGQRDQCECYLSTRDWAAAVLELLKGKIVPYPRRSTSHSRFAGSLESQDALIQR